MDESKRPWGLIAAVELETEPVRQRLDDMRALTIGRKPAWRGRLGDEPVVLLAGGMGKTNAAQAEARLQKLREAGGQSWGALSAALAESRNAFDRANQEAWDAFTRTAPRE